jgi:hypothetical protein
VSDRAVRSYLRWVHYLRIRSEPYANKAYFDRKMARLRVPKGFSCWAEVGLVLETTLDARLRPLVLYL